MRFIDGATQLLCLPFATTHPKKIDFLKHFLRDGLCSSTWRKLQMRIDRVTRPRNNNLATRNFYKKKMRRTCSSTANKGRRHTRFLPSFYLAEVETENESGRSDRGDGEGAPCGATRMGDE